MPDIVLSAQDSDVIKTYVELGLGVGLVAEQSGDAREADTFTRLDTRHLFDANTVWLGLEAGPAAAELRLALYRIVQCRTVAG